MKDVCGRPTYSRLRDVDVSVRRSRRDEERAPVAAAEAARGDVFRRHFEDGVEAATFVVAMETAAAVERDPDAAFVVDGEPVGSAVTLVDRDEGPPLVESARREPEIEDIDAVHGRVGEIHAGVVAGPAKAVRERHPFEHTLEPAVVAVESAPARLEVEPHRSDPETTGCVAGAVVRAHIWSVRQPDEGTHRFVSKVDQRKAIGQRDERRAAGWVRRPA